MSSGSEKDRVSEEIENGPGSNPSKSKRVALFRFQKTKNRLQKRKDKIFYANSTSVGCFGKRVSGGSGGGGVRGCFFCFKKRPILGSPVESRTSDPNCTEFSHESLRGLIESNDFYSKECNCHVFDDKFGNR